MHASVMRSMLVLCLLLLIYHNLEIQRLINCFMQFAVYVIMAYCENTKRTKKKKIFCS